MLLAYAMKTKNRLGVIIMLKINIKMHLQVDNVHFDDYYGVLI